MAESEPDRIARAEALANETTKIAELLAKERLELANVLARELLRFKIEMRVLYTINMILIVVLLIFVGEAL